MKTRSKIILSYVIFIALITGILGFLSINRMQEAHLKEEKENIAFAMESIYNLIDIREELLQEKMQNNINVAEKLLKELGPVRLEPGETSVVGGRTVPVLYAGNTKLNMNSDFVDQVSELVGGQSTIYVLHNNEFVRIATNVRLEDGERAVGTTVDSNSPVFEAIMNKKPYYARAKVVDEWYVTAYKPILDHNNNVIGMLFDGTPELDEKFIQIISDVRFGDTGYLYIMDSTGYLLFHPTHQGQSLKDYYFFDSIIEKKEGSIEYVFENSERLATLKYFEPWDWYVVSSVSIEDIRSNAKGIVNFVVTIGLVIFVIVVAVVVNQKLNCMRCADKDSADENKEA